jgi:MFS family permease
VTNTDVHPARWRMLALLAAAELMGMSLWFAASAVAPQLEVAWGLTGSETGWLTGSVQAGFVAGTALAAVLNLADLFPSRAYFATAAVLGAAANAGLLLARGFEGALVSRFFTGFCLAGVYPPAMKMISTWFRSSRGLAIGTIVGALTVGKAMPYLVRALRDAAVDPVVLTVSTGALIAAGLVAVGYRDGPYPFERRPFSWQLVGTVVRERRWRLATGGYLGHMWELYSFWTWIVAFLAASAAARADGGFALAPPEGVSLLGFAVIAVGGAGCVWGGLVADRIGYERLVVRAMAASGACALLIGTVFGGSWWLLVPVALAWGFFVIADSAQFSALVTQSVPPHAVGTALTLQTSLGFLLTMLTIQLVPPMVGLVGWRWAFVILALGPVLGIISIRRLKGLAPAAAVR